MTIRFAIIPWFDTHDQVWREKVRIVIDDECEWLADIHCYRQGCRLEIMANSRVEMDTEVIPPDYSCANLRTVLTFTPPPPPQYGSLKPRRRKQKLDTVELDKD